MLPIITVGLTPAARAAIERIPGGRDLEHFSSAEGVEWYAGGDEENGVPEAAERDADGRWRAHVVYGDDALGPILTATNLDPKPTQVKAVGAKIIITDSLGGDQFASRRVIDGTPEEREIKRTAVEAVHLIQATAMIIVDELGRSPQWAEAIARVLDNAEEQPVVTATENPGADAAKEIQRLEALRAQGQTRPGYFEQQGKLR